MANLNIPFLLPQGKQFDFKIDQTSSKIINSQHINESESFTDKKGPQLKSINKNMMVLADNDIGNLVLCDHSMILSEKKESAKTKFMVTVKPRIMCALKILPSADEFNAEGKDTGCRTKLMDFLFVKSPAQQILSTSRYLLLTIHQTVSQKSSNQDISSQGGYMRLWNTTDGRCLMISPLDMFPHHRKPYKLFHISDNIIKSQKIKVTKESQDLLNGLVLCVCQSEEILLINIHTMTIISTFAADFFGVQGCSVEIEDNILMITLIDKASKVSVIRTQRINLNRSNNNQNDKLIKLQKSRAFRQSSNLMLNHCDGTQISHLYSSQLKDIFSLQVTYRGQAAEKNTVINRGEHREILLISTVQLTQILVVHQDRVELIDQLVGQIDQTNEATRTLIQYEKEKYDARFDLGGNAGADEQEAASWLVFAEIVNTNDSQFLLLIDNEMQLLLFDLLGLTTDKRNSMLSSAKGVRQEQQKELAEKGLLFQGSLSELSHVFELQTREKDPFLEDEKDLIAMKVQKECQQDKVKFNFNESLMVLYTYMEIDLGTNHNNKLVSWSLQGLFNHVQLSRKDQTLPFIPTAITNLSLQGADEVQPPKNNILNLHPFIQKNYFSRHQHSFFYHDEKITDQTFYIASDFPSMILGTNYGRIFFVQLFQDIECRGYPIIALDCHQNSPITCLYISYSSARRAKQQQQDPKGAGDQNLAQTIALDSGGHLIASSENGTISVTNMNSGEIVNQLTNFTIRRNDQIKKRINSFMEEREKNQRRRRRQSFSGHYNFQQYFNLVKVSPLKVFHDCAFGLIKRIVEVQVIQQNQLDRMRYLQLGSGQEMTKKQSVVQQPDPLNSDNMTDSNQKNNSPISIDNESDAKLGAQTQFYKFGQQTYTHHLQQMNEMTIGSSAQQVDISQLQSPSPLMNELMPFKSSYGCIDETENAVYILSILKDNTCDMINIHGMDSTPIGIYEDALQNFIHVITYQNLNVYTFNKRSKCMVRKSNYTFAQSLLQLNQTLHALIEKQQYFKMARKQNHHTQEKHYYDQYSYTQQFQDGAASLGLARATSAGAANPQANSHHSVYDFMGLSLSLPLYYHPHHILSQKFTKTAKDLLMHRDEIKMGYLYCQNPAGSGNAQKAEKEGQTVKNILRLIIQKEFLWNDRYKSDFSQEYYQAQGAVTPLLTGSATAERSFRHQMLIINTKDMLNVFKGRIKILVDQLRRVQNVDTTAQKTMDNNGHHHHHHKSKTEEQAPAINIPAEYFQSSKWPTKLLAMVHPFSLDDNLDENLELFFGLSIPFLDSKIGVQGIDETFSFIIANDLRDKEPKPYDCLSTKLNISESTAAQMLKLSLIEQKIRESKSQPSSAGNNVFSSIPRQLTFVNSEFWKTSPYITSIMSSFFQSTLVSIIEFAQSDITTLMTDWLNAIQYITSPLSILQDQIVSQDNLAFDAQESLDDKNSLSNMKMELEDKVYPLSVSVLSQMMLRKDFSISSCARDILMKPLLLSSGANGLQADNVKMEINEWQDLIMDTYLKLKEDSSSKNQSNQDGLMKQHSRSFTNQQTQRMNSGSMIDNQQHAAEGPKRSNSKSDIKSQNASGRPSSGKRTSSITKVEVISGSNSQDSKGQLVSPAIQAENRAREQQQQRALAMQQQSSDKSINHFFGELEIRGLVNLSYYALYTQEGPDDFKIQQDVQNRLCKCTVILTREIMTKFTANCNEYQNMLTILMQLLQTQMRAQVPTFKTKVIKEDVIKILLLIYDFHKKQLKDERFLTRVVSQNFHLTHPKNAELFLKLTAAKTLLEIGTFFTEDFLMLIHEQATTLKDGPEYQRSVLDVLRYYINGSKDGLEPYLIQIVQTLLKCLDPNDEQLRKNSTQIISVILSTMVKNFPMIDFHHDTQRLAVGTTSGAIAIYDVRTSGRLKILEGHTQPVLALEFDKKGHSLASYSGEDLTLRIWKVGGSGFLQNLMGSSGKSAKVIELKRLNARQQAQNPRGMQKIQKMSARSIIKSRSQASMSSMEQNATQNQKCKITHIQNDKFIELTREDGSVETHKP